MNWHQQNAIRRNHELRHIKAHIVDQKRYGFWSLCGERVPQVTVEPEHAHKPHNNTCPKCLLSLKG